MSQFRNPRKVQLLPIATLLLAGCSGVIGAPGGSGENGQTGPGGVGGPGQMGGPGGTGPASDLTCTGGKIPASPAALHRLSPEEYASRKAAYDASIDAALRTEYKEIFLVTGAMCVAAAVVALALPGRRDPADLGLLPVPEHR